MSRPVDETLDDEALVARVRDSPADDLRAFDLLVHRHRTKVIANCRYITRQPEHAEDLAQEVFLKAYFALPRFRGGSSFRTWLHRIKINHCLDYLKRIRGRVFLDVDEPALAAEPGLSVDPTAERDLMRADARHRLSAALDSLPDGLRVPLVLRDLDGLPYAEIAETLDLSLPTIKMRILRGRRELRRRLETGDPAPTGAHRSGPGESE